ncbi:MAG TPA: SDR family NAD(P)-dependent oxidoreductase [Steroidobacteraceae bacterium]|nr:SDR family NAD(P)-dependent oxidoreductase [Steroidobacteraceae bacterium]
MELEAGKVAVVTGAASGIGFALAERFARDGLHVVLADVEEAALVGAADRIKALGAETLAVPTDVSEAAAVEALADAAVKRFGSVHVVCNNAGVGSKADPWFGPLSGWTWVLGVNLWGVVHGIRAFLPILAEQGEGHIVNTASILGLMPSANPSYDASKHAVVALSEDLFKMTKLVGLPVGVSVLCPGWVTTGIWDAERNWPARLGEIPSPSLASKVTRPHQVRANDAGMRPAAVADLVADAIVSDRYWVLPHPEFVALAVHRWQRIAEGRDPDTEVDIPGLPPATQIASEIRSALTAAPTG